MIQCGITIAGDRTMLAGCDGHLHVVDIRTGKIALKIDVGAPTLCTPAVVGTVAYVGTTGGDLRAVDTISGKELWNYMPERSSELRSSAAANDSTLFVGGRDKLLHAIDRKKGTKRWTFATKKYIDASPIIANDSTGRALVLLGSEDGIFYAISATDGSEVSRFEVGDRISASAAAADGRIVVGTENGQLICFGNK